MKTIAILGTVGVPAAYGGFETLVEHLVRFNANRGLGHRLIVYCSAKRFPERFPAFLGAELRYVGLDANGVSSIPYDIVSLLSAVRSRVDVILVLGVSGALALPLVRVLSRARIVTNIDGIEWKRPKWKGLARCFLRLSERAAVRFSHEVVADNAGIADHVMRRYGRDCHVIAYGGDHAVETTPKPYNGPHLPTHYALAICRIEPENNVAMILDAFAGKWDKPLVFVGNWDSSRFGRMLRQRYDGFENLHLLDPIYDVGVLHTLRCGASVYVHGHSAGGTNPSLVEMMHFGLPVVVFDCAFNRYTTNDRAPVFSNVDSLRQTVLNLSIEEMRRIGEDMKAIAQARYTWGVIGSEYFRLFQATYRQ